MNMLAKWAIAVALVGPCSAFGAEIAYKLGFTISNGEPGYAETVTGEIVTDGTTGVISASNILGGTIMGPLGTFTFSASGVSVIGGDLGLYATPTSLLYEPSAQQIGQCLPTNACGFQITSSNDPKTYLALMRGGNQIYIFLGSATNESGTYTFSCCITLAASAQIISAPVTGKLSGLVYNRSTQTFNSVLTLTNSGPITVQSPIAIQIATGTKAVTVAGPSDGTTYIANLPGGSLAPGASAEVVVAFSDPTRVGFIPSITGSVTSDATSAKVIGSAGGTLSVTNHLGDVLTLTIPPLALDQDTTISATALSSPLPSSIAKNLYPGVLLQPEGLLFSKPVNIALTTHDVLDNPNMSLLFWPKNSDLGLALPLASQTATQSAIGGQSYHFSTVMAAEPTAQEITTLQAAIKNSPLGSLTQVIDVAGSEAAIAGDCNLTGDDACANNAFTNAQTLISKEAAALLDATPPSNPCGIYSIQVVEFLDLGQRFGLDDTVSQLLFSRICKSHVQPQSLIFNLGAAPQTLTASFLMPDDTTPYSCVAAIAWSATDPTIAEVNPICNGANYLSCPVTPVGLGVTQVSAGCDRMVASATVSVCSATGIWGGTWSNDTGDSGNLYATITENNGFITAGINSYYISGTDDNGSVLLGPVSWSGPNGGIRDAYADGDFSSDCNTISGGWVKTKNDKAKFGSFSLFKLPGS